MESIGIVLSINDMEAIQVDNFINNNTYKCTYTRRLIFVCYIRVFYVNYFYNRILIAPVINICYYHIFSAYIYVELKNKNYKKKHLRLKIASIFNTIYAYNLWLLMFILLFYYIFY